MTSLLLLGDVFAFINNVFYAQYMRSKEAGDFNQAAIDGVWNYSFLAAQYLVSSEAHWLLAVHYWVTAVNTPKIIRKEKV